MTPVQSTSVRQPHHRERESTDPTSDDPTPTETDDSNFRSDVRTGDPVSDYCCCVIYGLYTILISLDYILGVQ